MAEQENLSSYRPHNPGHDYFAPGIYLITLVVRDRGRNASMFGCFNDDLRNPAVVLNDIGKAVMDCWQSIPLYQARHGRKVRLHGAVCMPDHFHGVIEVLEPMDKSLGEVIRGFKAGATMAFRDLRFCAGFPLQCPSMVTEKAKPSCENKAGSLSSCESEAGSLPSCENKASSLPSCENEAGSLPSCESEAGSLPLCGVQPYLDEREMLKRLSKKQRAEYYRLHPEAQQPLWDDNYDDTICLTDPVTGAYDQRHLQAMIRYVADNPRRAIIRRLRPEFTRRCLLVELEGRDKEGKPIVRQYAAFGNLFLLRWARKVQVFCHRKARFGMLTAEERQRYGYNYIAAPDLVTSVPYEQTTAYRQECIEWKRKVMEGATVIVTPGISKGESTIKNRCLESGYPLIHLQKEPIGRYWKPEQRRFDACANGSLLILAPWKPEQMGEVAGVPSDADYSIFHNLNALASEICDFTEEAHIVKG